jgi:hypothetical protein
LHTGLTSTVANGRVRSQTLPVRALAAILVAVGLGFAVYHYSLKKIPTTDEGTAPTQAINLTAVRMDLLQIAQAERTFATLNSHCATMDELLSSHSLSMQRPEREGYTYTVACSGSDADFTVTARHSPAPQGSPIRYPTLAVDQSMEIRELQ